MSAAPPIDTYYLHSRFDRVLNYTSSDGRLHALVLPEIGAGPGISIVSVFPSSIPQTITVRDGRLATKAGPWSIVDTAYDPSLRIDAPLSTEAVIEKAQRLAPLFPPLSPAFLFLSTRTQEFVTPTQQAYMKRLRDGADQLSQGHREDGARILRGLGPGLTPTGDDFLCGWLWASHITHPAADSIRDRIFQTAQGSNVLVNHFLRAAHTGLYFEHFKNFVTALLTGSRHETERTFRDILRIGATSGADTAAGFIWGYIHR